MNSGTRSLSVHAASLLPIHRPASAASRVSPHRDRRRRRAGCCQQAIARQRRLEVLARLVEEAHRVQVVAERRAFERAELQNLVLVRKRLERMMQRQGDEPGGERPPQLLEPRHHLLKKIVVVQPPADLLGHLKIRLEQAALKPIGRVHHLPVQKPGRTRPPTAS